MTASLFTRLGLSPTDRALILHADDLGMCHAHNTAFADVVAAGIARCGSVMVPTPWFSEAAAYARAHPEADIGVHLTLTSEWQHYRWRPISAPAPAGGLCDGDGFFWRATPDVQRRASVAAALAEARAQIDAALAAGIDVTHIDTHMGSIFHPDWVEGYLGLAQEYNVPALLPRVSARAWELAGFTPEALARYQALVDEAEALCIGPMDWVGGPRLDDHRDRFDAYDRLFASIPAGLAHFYYHAASDTDELAAIAPDAPARVADREVLTSPRLRDLLDAHGIRPIGYRELRDAMRAARVTESA